MGRGAGIALRLFLLLFFSFLLFSSGRTVLDGGVKCFFYGMGGQILDGLHFVWRLGGSLQFWWEGMDGWMEFLLKRQGGVRIDRLAGGPSEAYIG